MNSIAKQYGAQFGACGGARPGDGAPYSLATPGENGAAASGAGLWLPGGQVGTPGGAASGSHNGAEYDAEYGASRRPKEADAAFVIYRLEEAGRTLLALPASGHSTRLRTGGLDYVRDAAESYGWTDGRIRPAVPPAARITRMDEALAWVGLIPPDKVVLRRIVGCRSLVSPVTERHLFSWRRLAVVVGADHKAVQRWHAQGIDFLVAQLRAGAGARG